MRNQTRLCEERSDETIVTSSTHLSELNLIILRLCEESSGSRAPRVFARSVATKQSSKSFSFRRNTARGRLRNMEGFAFRLN